MDVCAECNEGDDAHGATALRTDEREHLVDAGDQRGPQVVRGWARFGFSLCLVVGIADGDTITVLDADKVQHKIRLAGIDAPEKKQAFGSRSKESLSAMTFDKTVNVETSKRDRYGRQIGKVLANGRDVNLVQVERDMAWFYRQYQREQSPNDRRLYDAAEDAARADKRAGLGRTSDLSQIVH